MNDEIKEILIKDFNEILVKEFCTDWKEKRLYIELLVNSTPFSNLLDYITNLQTIEQQYSAILSENAELENKITNLQQINKNLTNSLNKKVEEGIKLQLENDKLQEQFKDWKKEIEKEKKYYLCDRTDCCGRIKNSKKYSSIYHELEDYKSRNEKAIEYLGINEEILETCEIYDVNGIEVYKILQGSDKE